MKIQGMDFPNEELIFYIDYATSERAGATGCFQVVDISIGSNVESSILNEIKIDQGKHYFNIHELLNDLNLDIKTTDYRVEII